jgi:hypothetical protein
VWRFVADRIASATSGWCYYSRVESAKSRHHLKNPLEDEDEDDDEDDYEREAPYSTRPEAMLIANANMTVLNKNDNRAWTNDKRRIPLEVMDTSDT